MNDILLVLFYIVALIGYTWTVILVSKNARHIMDAATIRSLKYDNAELAESYVELVIETTPDAVDLVNEREMNDTLIQANNALTVELGELTAKHEALWAQYHHLDAELHTAKLALMSIQQRELLRRF